MSESVAEHLNRRLKLRIQFKPFADREDQALRTIGTVVQWIVKVGNCWSWLIVKDGVVLMGEVNWDHTPEDAVKAADDAMAAADAMGG